MLEDYKRQHGDCNVPSKGDHKELANWCNRMRYAYKNRGGGGKSASKISDGEVQQLESIGFRWKKETSNTSFDEMYQKLVTFKQVHGHCKVPQGRNMDKDAQKLAK